MTHTPPVLTNIFDRFLGDRLAEGAGRRRAVWTDEASWTYADVHARATRCSTLLADLGVEPGDRVVLALPDGIDYVTVLFGILHRGAVAVMVNPHLSPEQIRYFFTYTDARLGLVGTDTLGAFRAATGGLSPAPEVVEADGEAWAARLAAAAPAGPAHPSGPDAAAIFLFSGGTTGHPKGVVQTHRSFANTTVLYGRGVLGIGPDDVTLSVPKLYFGYATGTNLFFPFSVGATSALFSERCTAETLFEKIERFRPTVLVNVPTMVHNLLSDPTAPTRDLSCLRLATSAGEALPADLHRRWTETFGVPLLDGLGTAEMWHIFVSNRPGDVRPGTLGRAVPGFEVVAADEAGRPVPAGEVGVMRVRGDSLALGYWRDPEKTEEAFRDGWFVSSDMISIDAEGYVIYCGRADDMLKVSGKWLSPRELEDCLVEHPAVGEAAVVGARTPEGLVKPKAYVTLAGGVEPGAALAAELQAWARERLEPYKYPREVAFMDEMPRTHLGKIDRGRLARGEA